MKMLKNLTARLVVLALRYAIERNIGGARELIGGSGLDANSHDSIELR